MKQNKRIAEGTSPLRYSFGLPERIRTFGLQSRSLTRYPAVPRADVLLLYNAEAEKSSLFLSRFLTFHQYYYIMKKKYPEVRYELTWTCM